MDNAVERLHQDLDTGLKLEENLCRSESHSRAAAVSFSSHVPFWDAVNDVWAAQNG